VNYITQPGAQQILLTQRFLIPYYGPFTQRSVLMNRKYSLLALTSATALLLAACSGSKTPESAGPGPVATAPAVEDAATAALIEREAALKAKEAELAAREADLEKANAAPAVVAVPEPAKPAAKPVSKPTSKPSHAATPASTKPAAPTTRVVTVPSGSTLNLALAADITTQTAKVGDVVRARVVSNVVVDGRVAIAAGTTVAGQVTQVVSGHQKIGGVPTLGLRFERLELAGGKDVPINGEITQLGKSDRARDTAKIIGGAAAGAVIGRQTNDKDSGTIIGGILGGAAGALAAKKTGTEVQLAAGSELAVVLGSPIEMTVGAN
jgi:Tfp pilus assembly protein PilX